MVEPPESATGRLTSPGSTGDVVEQTEGEQGRGIEKGAQDPEGATELSDLTGQGVSMDTWDDVRRFLGFEKASGLVIGELIRAAVEGARGRDRLRPGVVRQLAGSQSTLDHLR